MTKTRKAFYTAALAGTGLVLGATGSLAEVDADTIKACFDNASGYGDNALANGISSVVVTALSTVIAAGAGMFAGTAIHKRQELGALAFGFAYAAVFGIGGLVGGIALSDGLFGDGLSTEDKVIDCIEQNTEHTQLVTKYNYG